MALDEIGESNPQSVHTCAYTLFNGKGKLQGHKDGGNREQKYWKTAVISTGECDIETYFKQVGIKSNAGQLVRLLNMPVTRPTVFHGYQNGKAHADALKAAWIENHGAAGREWIKYLASQKEEALNAFKAAKKRWQSLIPEHFGEQVMRVTDRFAVIEAALTLGEVITGWNAYSCQEALQKVFKRWLSVFGVGNKEYEQIIEQADGFLSSFGLSRFAPLDYDEKSLPIRDLAGYRVIKPNQPVEYYVFPQVFKDQIAKGFNHTQFAKTLHEAGMLQKPTSGKGYQVLTPRLKHLGDIQQRTYLLVQHMEDTQKHNL